MTEFILQHTSHFLIGLAAWCLFLTAGWARSAHLRDKQDGIWEQVRGHLGLYAYKAERDHNPMARIPTSLLRAWFKLDARVVPGYERVSRGPGRHPATMSAERVKKLGRHGKKETS